MRRIYGTFGVLLIALLVLTGCQPVTREAAAPQAETAATEAATEAATTGGGMMEHGGMMHGNSDAPFDALFLDGMIMHHEGAIVMAQQALAESEHDEVRELSEAIISAQQTEIEQMQSWRSEWYPDLEPTMGGGMHMGMMQIPTDGATPFDQRFLEAMIDHHQGAIQMATEALAQSEHDEVRSLSERIIDDQQAEIEQMQAMLGR